MAVDESATASALAGELGLDSEERELVADLLRLKVTPQQIRSAASQGQVQAAIFEGCARSRARAAGGERGRNRKDGGLQPRDQSTTAPALDSPHKLGQY
jgi:hypothetical protein